MDVNGHQLPELLVDSLANGFLTREVGSWLLANEVDSFGNRFESELGQVFATREALIRETQMLSSNFQSDGIYGETSEWSDRPGFIEDITDFSEIVAFGMSADGAPFCLDYRSQKAEPEVIWWDDTYWRKVSNSFGDFLTLFNFER